MKKVFTTVWNYVTCDADITVSENKADSLKKILNILSAWNDEGEFDFEPEDINPDNNYYTYEQLQKEIKDLFFQGANPHENYTELYFEMIYRENCNLVFSVKEL